MEDRCNNPTGMMNIMVFRCINIFESYKIGKAVLYMLEEVDYIK